MTFSLSALLGLFVTTTCFPYGLKGVVYAVNVEKVDAIKSFLGFNLND